MGNYSARFGGGHLEKGRNAPRQVSTLQLYPLKPFYPNLNRSYMVRRIFWSVSH
jgi:hypothetical protein